MQRTLLSNFRTPAMMLILDFDGTLTHRDTLHFLASIATTHHQTQRLTSPSPAETWPALVSAYTTAVAAHNRSYYPPAAQRITPAAEIAYLASLAPLEAASIARVEESSIFRGISVSEINAAARDAVQSAELRLRKGWAGLLSQAAADGGRVKVLSVNWSEAWIRGCLAAAAEDDEVLRRVLAEKVDVVSNELHGVDSVEGAYGKVGRWKGEERVRGVHASGDKKAEMMEIVRDGAAGERVVYVGDSITDLECILAADLGVCVKDEPMSSSQKELADTLKRIGVDVRCISDLENDVISRKDTLHHNVVVWTHDMVGVAHYLAEQHRGSTGEKP